MLSREQFKAVVQEKALVAYEKRANKVVDYIGREMENNRPAMYQMLHNFAGPTHPLSDLINNRSKNP